MLAAMSARAKQEQMLKNLADFDINKISCTRKTDSEFILGAISQWYGSLGAFTAYVPQLFSESFHFSSIFLSSARGFTIITVAMVPLSASAPLSSKCSWLSAYGNIE